MFNPTQKKEKRIFSRREFLRTTAWGGVAVALTACVPVAPTGTAGSAGGDGADASAGSDSSMASDGPMQGGTLTWMGHQEVAGMSPKRMSLNFAQREYLLPISGCHSPISPGTSISNTWIWR